MNTILDQIILDSDSVAGSVNHDLLMKNTEIVAFRDVEAYGLENIRQLCILSSADALRQSLSLRTGIVGCHLNREYGWLLLIAPETREREQVIAACSSRLERLDLRFSDVSELQLGHLSGLRTLKLWHNARLRHVNGLDALKELHVKDCSVLSELDVGSLPELESLCVIGGPGWSGGLSGMQSLTTLELGGTACGKQLDLNGLISLQSVFLSGDFEMVRLDHPLPQMKQCMIMQSSLKRADFLRYMPNLQLLMLNNSPLTDLPDLRGLRELFYVDLENTRLHRAETLPDGIETLNLSRTDLRQVPECVRSMEYLGALYLNGLKLRELPLWLHELRLPVFVRRKETEAEMQECITLFGTQVEGVDMYMIPEQWELLRGWLESYHAQMRDGERPINEIKVVFLGDGEAGKSLVVNRLLNGGKHPPEGTFCGDSTPGVAIYHKTMPLEDRHMRVHYWDFGGQEILHAMHRIFQTHRTVYVVVLNARNDTQDERALYWLRSIRSFDGRAHENARILFVLNKTDQNPRASINMTALRRLQPDLPDPVLLSAKRYSQQEFNDTLGAALKREIQAMENLQAYYPATWYRVKLRLEDSNQNCIDTDDFDEICDQEGVEDDETLRDSLQELLKALGVIFRYQDTRTEDNMLLRPEWVTNAVYKVLFNRHDKIHNGLISFRELKNCICSKASPAGQYWCVAPEIKYRERDVSYILDVLEKHKLLFNISSQQVFIPMLCERNASTLLGKYADDPHVVEVWWRFEYLPQNLLFALMVERYRELDREHVWLGGVRFTNARTESSAILCRDGNTLKIYVRGEGEQSNVKQYYKSLEEDIQKVIDSFTEDPNGQPYPLQKEDMRSYERFLVYKAADKREFFDMDRLEKGGNRGVSLFYSKSLATAVSAEEILNGTLYGTDAVQRVLLRDILDACRSIQRMRVYWDSKDGSRENSRNSQIRVFLQARYYHVFDQTLCGESGKRKQEGELDLEIRRDHNKPWTIYEGLNLSSTELNNWDSHLDKLLENYNPHGLKFLLLVSYVHCEREKFLEIWDSYALHIPRYDPGKYRCIPNSYMDLSDDYVTEADLLKIAQCDYTCGGSHSRVYHIFVHLGERKG